MTDFNTPIGKHHQWFYFEIRNMRAGVPYTFHILNFVKPSSSFEDGKAGMVVKLF